MILRWFYGDFTVTFTVVLRWYYCLLERTLGIFLTPDSCFPYNFTPKKVVFSKICDTLKKNAKKFWRDWNSNLRSLEPWREMLWSQLLTPPDIDFLIYKVPKFRRIRNIRKKLPQKKICPTFLIFRPPCRPPLIRNHLHQDIFYTVNTLIEDPPLL